MRKHTLYKAVTFGLVLLSVAAIIAAYTGTLEPLVSPSQVPGGEAFLFGGIVVVVLVGVVVNVVIVNRSWKAMGEQANLTPESGGLPIGKPDLTGTVNGRAVRARTLTRGEGSSATEGTNSSVTYTIVEADLAEPVEDGLVIGLQDGESDERLDVGNGSVMTTAIDDTFHVVGGGSEDRAKAVLSQRSRNALLDVEELGSLTVGNPIDSVLDAVPDTPGSFIGDAVAGKMESAIRERFPGDARTVAHESKGVLLDPDELEQQAAAVAALAESFEDAEAGR